MEEILDILNFFFLMVPLYCWRICCEFLSFENIIPEYSIICTNSLVYFLKQ